MRLLSLVALLSGCSGSSELVDLDLTQSLDPTQVRAGVITTEDALFGGIAAEGRVGDVLLVNDRARFVIQGPRGGDYYVQQGGGVIDADIVRPDDEPGRDMVEEWMTMAGLGRLMDAEQVVVMQDGVLEPVARVVAEGPESQMGLITGALGGDSLIPDLGLRMRTSYVLRPGTPFLEVETTLIASEDVEGVTPGVLLMGASERFELWDPGVGLEVPASDDRSWTGYTGVRNDGAVAIFPEPGGTVPSGGISLIADLAGLTGGLMDPVDIVAGDSHSFRYRFGVGRDLASLTDAWFDDTGEAFDEHGGEVMAPDGPVSGARVHIDVDGEPFTLAVTDDAGQYSARVPAGSTVTATAVGRSTGRHTGLANGAPPYGPYSSSEVHQRILDAWDASVEVPVAEGRGIGTDDDPLTLGEPGQIEVDCGGPCVAFVRHTETPTAGDPRLAPSWPGGDAAQGWAGGDGTVTMPIAAGTYDVLVHRGIRFEYVEETVTVEAGAVAAVSATFTPAYEHAGWLLADPHSHAAPSNDGELSMSDRIHTSAGFGLQLHFGTDHDHVADYNPVVEGVGLQEHLRSVVADEVSSVQRGHFNAYPLMLQTELPNNGAFLWWSETDVTTTDGQMAALRERHGDIVIQSNHPMSSGLASQSGWSPGVIGRAERWTEDIDAVELCNAANCEEAWDFVIDLIQRGNPVVPVGVSDSHGHTSGRLGLSATFIASTTDDPAVFTDTELLASYRDGATIITRGPFLDSSIRPGTVFTALDSQTWEVEALSPSWVVVDQLELWKNGELADTVTGTSATFTLEADSEAWWMVVARGSTSMAPVYPGRTPFAATAPVYYDPDDDGWDGVLPAFEIE